MSSLIYSPSVAKFSNPTPQSPHVIVLKIRILDSGKVNVGRLAPVFGPLGVSPKQIADQILRFVNSLNWTSKRITIRFIIKSRNDVEMELAEHSPLLIFSNLRETSNSNDGNLTFDQVLQIARNKTPSTTARTLLAKVKEVLGTCTSIGCKVNGEDPRVILCQLNNGMCPFKIPETEE